MKNKITPRYRHLFFVLPAIALLVALTATSLVYALSPGSFEGGDGNLVVNVGGEMDWENAPNLRAMYHVNLLRCLEFGLLKDRFYAAREWFEGESAYEHIEKKGPMSPKMALGMGISVCHALAALKEQGALHLDIRPLNILKTSTGLKLAGAENYSLLKTLVTHGP